MTEAQFAYLDVYIRDLANRMGLKDWRVELQRTPVPADESETSARTWMTDRTRLTKIEVHADFGERSPEEQREVLVHELIHSHFWRADRVVYRLERHLVPALWSVVEDAYNEEQDLGIDALAWVIAPHMPPLDLPPDEAAPS